MTDDTEQPQPKTTPVTFTDEQQTKIDEIVKKAMGRAGKEAREQLDIERAEKSRLTADLQAAKDALVNAASTIERDELEQQIQTISQELQSEKQSRRDSENREISYRRSALIAQMCVDNDLIDCETVAALTENNLVWNADKKSFDVVDNSIGVDTDDDGIPQEVSLAAFFSNFATKRPYLVKSSIRTGSGSGDSSRSGLPTGRQEYKVEEIFGRGSNSQLANRLAQKDPAAYRRLKAEARNKKLI
jgi:hypothetical protein